MLRLLRDAKLRLNYVTIHEAVRQSDAPALARHLVLNTDVNVHDKWGMTPLHIASEKGNARLVRILLGMGADPTLCTTSEPGWIPPLVVATSHGHFECLDSLVNAGALVNAEDRWGNTAVLKACSGGHYDCVSSLLRFGADPTTPNHFGATCLHACASLGFHDILTSLLNSGCYDVTSEEVQSALITAASRGFHQCVETLLKAGCSPNRKGSHEEEPQTLFFALTYCAGDDEEEPDEGERMERKTDATKCVHLLINAGSRITTHCLELLSEVMCQNEGKYFDTAIEVLSSMSLNLNQGNRSSLEYNAIAKLLNQLPSLGDDQQCKLIDTSFKLGFKADGEILNSLQDKINERNFLSLKEFSEAKPLSLQDLSRLAIRSMLKPNVATAVQSLPLPVMLKKSSLTPKN